MASGEGDKGEFSGKRRWIVGIEGTDKSQRGLVAAILEERGGPSGGGRKEIGKILEGGYALGQQYENRHGGHTEGKSAERAAVSSSREESRGATGEAIGCISSDRSAVKL